MLYGISPYSIAERRVPEVIPVLGSQPAGDVSHKPGARLPLFSAGTLKMRDMKMRHQNARVENARHEFSAPDCRGGKCET